MSGRKAAPTQDRPARSASARRTGLSGPGRRDTSGPEARATGRLPGDDPEDGAGELDLREISRAALVTALALALPWVFHLVRLGKVFLPMVLPLLAGAFLLRRKTAVVAAAATPLISALATGMPPLYPPIAGWMSVELGTMAFAAATLHRTGRLPRFVTVALALLVSRTVYAALAYSTTLALDLPAGAFTVVSLVASWPGLLLALLVVPPAVAAIERRRSPASS